MSRVGISQDTVPAETRKIRVRKWKVFPGKNTFFCDGRCICAPNWYGFLCCLVIYVIMGALFFAFDCRYLVVHVSPAIPVIGALLYLYILGALCTAALTDPGIIPRATMAETEDDENQTLKGKEMVQGVDTDTDTDNRKDATMYKVVEIGGRKFLLQYCRTCHIFRPPRSTHCRHCDNCVERFDHHCPMVGNCIGKRNYRHFYLFLTSVAVFAAYVVGCNIAVIVLKAKQTTATDAVKDSVPTMIEMIVGVAALLIVGGFLCFHTYLIAMEMTTNEFLKGTYSARKHEDSKNPYRHKMCCSNCIHILCSPKHVSLIDRRGFSTTEPTRAEGRAFVSEKNTGLK